VKNIIREILGFEVQVTGVAESISELIAAIGSESGLVDTANNQVLAHSHFTDVRKLIVKTAEAHTKIPRATKKDGEKEVYAETEQTYIARLETELDEEAFATLTEVIGTAVAALPVDYKPGTRGAGASSSKLAAKWYEAVADLKKKGRYDEFVSRHTIVVPEAVDESEEAQKAYVEALDTAVALKIKTIVTEREKAAKLAAMAEL